METTTYPKRAGRLALVLTIGLLGLSAIVHSQSPTVTVRFANPAYDCITGEYCLDVEFQSNAPNVQLFGMNVRFFYDDTFMELIGFSDFQGGYGPVAPNPPSVMMTIAGTGTTSFGFPPPGVADFVNGAIQLTDNTQPPLFISTTGWTKLYQVCFNVDGTLPDSSNFCPPIVWDLEANPANGGYLPGDDGIVITAVAPPPAMSGPTNEQVIQFNWNYTGQGAAPFGAPAPTQCVSLLCPVDLALTKTLDIGQDDPQPGDDLDFTIEVTNEGDIQVGEIHLIDYIPVGFSLNDPDWTAGNLGSTGQSASIILSEANGELPVGGLLSGQSVTVQITLHIDPSIPSGVYENFAEISFVYDVAGADVSNNDSDSTPDEDDTNDPVAEDDHDGALICLLEPPVILGAQFVCRGDTVTYEPEEYNPDYTYLFTLSGGGTVYTSTDSSITIIWTGQPGDNFELSLTVTAFSGCEETNSIFVMIEEAGALACIDHTNISIDNACGTVVVSGMILTGDQEGNNTYEVFVIDSHGDTIPNATLTWEHVGQTFKVSVASKCTGQSCWGYITVEDKLGPIINCICPVGGEGERCNITCLQIDQILNGNIPDHLRPRVIDNCGAPTLELTNVDLSFAQCSGGYVRVEWLATDGSGNTSTCIQEFNIVPLNLETLLFPADYIGECGDNSDPSNTGWPQVNGGDITLIPGQCNIISSYKDKVIQQCGGGTKIMRTWTVFDWCVPTKIDHVQFIHLADHTGPVLTCPQNISVSTDAWACNATVTIARPQARDACSTIASYKLTSNAGIVVPQGNSYVIRELPIGVHKVTWTVTDECYNSTICSFYITVADNVPPAVSCHLHTVVALTSDRPQGLTLVSADAFDDGSYDNCSNVTFRARRMTSCIDFNWTTEGACMDDIPGGNPPIDSRDHGTVLRDCVPFACCDIGQPGIMVELEVTDEAGNKNYCMVEVEVQDKLAPELTCPEEIYVSCEFLFDIQEGIFRDTEGNRNGSLDEDPLSELFGNMYDAARYTQADRRHIIINDPNNPQVPHPNDWGLEGWALDNCELDLSVEVKVIEDCTGSTFPGKSVRGAVKLIQRIFRGYDGVQTGSCVQQIWVVDYNRFHIEDTTCSNENPNDGVIWPCDVLLNTCPDDIGDTGEPIILNDGCSIIGVSHKDTRFDFVDSVCFKIRREWKVLDWCQFDPNTGYGIWTYVQTIKVADAEGVTFLDAPTGPVEYCLTDPGISLPANNQLFLGEDNPLASSCSVHVDLGLHVQESCSGSVLYDVKIYPFNGLSFIQVVPETEVLLDTNHVGEIRFNTAASGIPSVSANGLPYTSAECGEYHRVLWTVEDGCGNRSYADYLFRLEDCKDPTPVCIDGLSTVVMPQEGEVTVFASSFNGSSFDDCTPGDELVFSFSGTTYQPTFTYTCDNVPAFGVELPVDIWAADGGVDQNCDGQIQWNERNSDFCTTYIVITDNNNVCDNQGGVLEGEIMTEHTDAVSNVSMRLSSPSIVFPETITAQDGKFSFDDVPPGADYTIVPQRNDDPRNGVSTLDLVYIQKHLLGKELFSSPYQYIAADANNSQSVSAVDLIEIRKLILGLQDELPTSQSWRFVPKTTEMAPGNPWPFNEQIQISNLNPQNGSGLDFVGVKVGDVNHSAKANAAQVMPRNSNQSINVMATGRGEFEVGEEVEIELSFPQMVAGFQWTMETTDLEYLGVRSEDIQIGEQHIGRHANGVLTMSWNGELRKEPSGETGMAIYLRFRVTKPGRLMDMIALSNKVTPTEAYAETGDLLDVNLTFSSTGIIKDFALYQNKPNPWNNHTIIGFHLPAEAEAILTVYDLNGQVIRTFKDVYKAGYNSVMLSTDDVSAAGVYYYRLESGGNVASKKMVLVR